MKPFDGTFVLGSLLVVVAIGAAAGALMTDTLPIIGSGRGALLAVAVVGMAGCAVAGISQAPLLGWTNPSVIAGAGLGVVALAVIGAGLCGWDGLLQPVASMVPVGAGLVMTSERIAIFALAAVIALKWVIGVEVAMTRAAT